MHGKGVYTCKDGKKFEGQWKNDFFCNGKVTYLNGDIYDGRWLHDKRHGLGIYTWTDGKKYTV